MQLETQGALSRSGVARVKQPQQRPHRDMPNQLGPHGCTLTNRELDGSTNPPTLDVVGVLKITKDRVRTPLRDPNRSGDVTHPSTRMRRRKEQDLRMVRDERPRSTGLVAVTRRHRATIKQPPKGSSSAILGRR
jgi:hypothetical protein